MSNGQLPVESRTNADHYPPPPPRSCTYPSPSPLPPISKNASAEAEKAVVRRRHERAERLKVEYYAILRSHQQAVSGLVERAAAEGLAETDAAGLAQARQEAMSRLTENYIHRREVAA